MSKDKRLIDLDDGIVEPQESVTDVSEPTSDITAIVDSITSRKSQKPSKTQVSIYLDDDVHKRYMRFGRRMGQGSRSELVNNLLKEALKDF